MPPSSPPAPLIVAIGGTAKAGSSTELALTAALDAAAALGARTRLFAAAELAALPLYLTGATALPAVAIELIAAVRDADGILLASPGYHGSVSGLVKNALDYLEETARDTRPYWDGLPVGLIVTAYGWQATGSTLAAMRAITHALRGWPTPLGVALNSAGGIFDPAMRCDPAIRLQLETVARQVMDFAVLRRHAATLDPAPIAA